jgi:hypothetical protein
MKRDDPASTMAKTQTYMLSTLAPLTTPTRRYHDRTPSSSIRQHSVLARPNPVIQLAASFAADMRGQLKGTNLPEIKKDKNVMLEEWLNQALEGEGDEAAGKETLRTLRKYGLDKHGLRNMGLSH